MVNLVVCNGIFAQQSIPSENLFARADSLSNLKNYVQADSLYRIIIHENCNRKNADPVYRATNSIYKNGIKQGRNLEAAEELESYVDCLSMDSIQLRARILFKQARLYYKAGSFHKSIQKYQKLIPTFMTLKDSTFLRSCLRNTSMAYARIGDQKSAIRLLDRALELTDKESQAKRYCSYLSLKGKYYFHDNNNLEAEKLYLQVLEDCSNTYFALIFLVELQIQQDSLEKAKSFIQMLKTFELELPELQIVLSDYYHRTGEIEQALDHRRIALEMLKKSGDWRYYIKEQIRLARILQEVGRLDSAFYHSNAALTRLVKFNDPIQLDTLRSEDLPNEIWAAEALMIRANYFEEKYKETNAEEDLRMARKSYHQVFDQFERQQRLFVADNSKYRIGAHLRDFYNQYLRFIISLGKQYEREAFLIAQRTNASVLRNALSEREVFDAMGVSQKDIARYYEIKSDLQRVELGMDHTTETLQYFVDSLTSKYPQLFKLAQSKAMAANDIQALIPGEAVLLKYHHLGDRLLCFAITRGEFQLFEIVLDKALMMALDEYKKILNKNFEDFNQEDEARYIQSGRFIYEKLLKKVLENERFATQSELIVVPDGPLNGLSFASLPKNAMSSWLDHDQYLIQDYGMRYLLSCTQLTKKKKNKDGFFAAGIDYKDEYFKGLGYENAIGQIAILPFAPMEAEACSKIYDGNYIQNDELQKNSLRRALNSYGNVHLAMHNIVDVQNHLNSHFLIYPDSAGGTGKFYYSDILKLENSPNLMVLSACQSAYGEDISSEGLMSMSRAFLQTGTQSVLSAYWNVPDKMTMEMMKLFHGFYKGGQTASEALRQAQLAYLKDDDISTPMFRTPQFWGGWVVYGAGEIQEKPSYFWLPAIGVILISVLLLYFKS